MTLARRAATCDKVAAITQAFGIEMEQAGNGIEARVDELEARLALQDQALIELNDELFRQQQQIAQLESTLRRLGDYLDALSTTGPADGSQDETPPHY